MKDLISIIIPFYKKKEFFEEKIKSVKNQKYKNYEILLIYDDPDKSLLPYIKKILKKIKNKRIFINKKNYGAGHSRNIGIKKAKGNFIAFLDADDTWNKNKLLSQLNFMKHQKCDFSFTSYSIINNRGQILKKIKAKNEISYNDLLNSCDIGLSTVLMKKKLFKNLKFPKLKTKEDFVLWLLVLKKGYKIGAIRKVLTLWRKVDNSLSSSVLQKLIDGFRVYHVHMNFNVFKSLYFLLVLILKYLKK
mgnify:CR=1 FL=1